MSMPPLSDDLLCRYYRCVWMNWYPVEPPPWTDAHVASVRCKVTANDNITLPGKRRPLA